MVQETLAHAQKSGDDKKLKVAASKKKKLADRGGLEKNEKGHRFGLNKCVLARSSMCTYLLQHEKTVPVVPLYACLYICAHALIPVSS